MSAKVIAALVIICVLTPAVVLADVTVAPDYDDAVNYGQWYYEVSMDNTIDMQSFYVYLDPNMQWNYVTGVGNSAGWSNPGSLGTVGSGDWAGLKYLAWDRSGNATAIEFYFEDAHYDTGGGHIMDLVNHAGPLLLDPPSNADAYSVSWVDAGFTSHYRSLSDGFPALNAITPEPTTLALFGLGVLGLAARLRRRAM